jgi:hypothetical protein
MNIKSIAQVQVQGEYVFSRQEMVAAFNFSPDGKFEFFFSYGAVDRGASGTFMVDGTKLKLKSDKEAGNDFTIINQSKTAAGYVIKFEDRNKYLLTDIRCTFFIDNVAHEEFTDNNGEIKVDFPHCDKIFVRHDLFPDIPMLIKDEKNDNNQFSLTLNPSLGQVSFKGIDLTIEDDKTLSCIPNYFMMLENIEFEKQ